MTKARAMTEAVKRWGKGAGIRFNRTALTEDKKSPMRERLAALRTEKLPETKQERDRLISTLLWHRCEVGHLAGVGGIRFFVIDGQGDTWEEAFTKAARR